MKSVLCRRRSQLRTRSHPHRKRTGEATITYPRLFRCSHHPSSRLFCLQKRIQNRDAAFTFYVNWRFWKLKRTPNERGVACVVKHLRGLAKSKDFVSVMRDCLGGYRGRESSISNWLRSLDLLMFYWVDRVEQWLFYNDKHRQHWRRRSNRFSWTSCLRSAWSCWVLR